MDLSVVIVTWNGRPLLERFLPSVLATDYPALEVVVADNASEDGTAAWLAETYPDVVVVRHAENGLFAKGNNDAVPSASGDVLCFLNNDVEVPPGWLTPLVAALDDPEVVAVQPKLLQHGDRTRFEYAGASGGFLDAFGYPFTRGRIFDALEPDIGQYDDARDVFWATGAALVVRREAFESAGGFDESFGMHMEEIDLCWRLQLAGFRIRSVPSSVVYHYGGWSLKSESFRKAYLNHRNQLAMLLKNLSLLRLAWVLPLRILLTLGTLPLGVIKQDWKQPAAFLGGLAWICVRPLHIIERRAEAQRARRISDKILATRMHPGSIALQYFLRGKKTATELLQTGPGG